MAKVAKKSLEQKLVQQLKIIEYVKDKLDLKTNKQFGKKIGHSNVSEIKKKFLCLGNLKRIVNAVYIYAYKQGTKDFLTTMIDCLKKDGNTEYQIAEEMLGVSESCLNTIKKTGLVQKRVIERWAQRMKKGTVKHTLNNIYDPICELEEIIMGESHIAFKKTNKNTEGYLERLKKEKGIYIFYDSLGKAIYAGKTEDQTLFDEMNNVLFRNRGDAQVIYKKKWNQISKHSYKLKEVAAYVSAYQVRDEFISNIEALFVRAFPNDLTNVRIEKIQKIEEVKAK
jgi:hypothetical protein